MSAGTASAAWVAKGHDLASRAAPPRGPVKAVLDLGAVPTAPGCARAWTRQILWEWRLAALSDTTEVIVSELTTNAVLASRRECHPCILLTLTLRRG